ncbi:MAG: hypothetical protein Q9216_002265 [Gyalolechia sp. 2 TL-2023]
MASPRFTDYYDAWAPPNNGYVGHFPTRDEKKHAERRRIVNGVYSMSSVLESEESINACTQLFCEKMQHFAQQGSVVDLGLWINMYAFDVLGELFYGKMFGFMYEHMDVGGYMKAIDSLLPAFTIGGTLPSYLTKLYFLSTILISPSVRGALGAVKHIEHASEKAVENRKMEMAEEKDDKHDILRKMLEINADRGEKINFTYQDICVESHSSIFAGADTTAIAINSILYHLMRNPTVHRTLTAEIDTAIENNTLTLPVAYASAIKLPYLRACINESMRLNPSVGLPMPRTIPAAGARISGFDFPPRYRIGINSAVVQYDRDVFGEDAEVFRPERWIEGKADAARMERTMMVFGAGARTCIGKNVSFGHLCDPGIFLGIFGQKVYGNADENQISLSEIYKLVPQIIRQFNLRLADPNKEWRTRNYWFNKQTEIYAYLEERKLESD